LIALPVALDQVTTGGSTTRGSSRCFALSIAPLTLVAARERRAGPTALVPPDVMGNRGFAFATLAVLLMSATFFASAVYLPQLPEKIVGWSPVKAGVGMLPMMGLFAAGSFASGPLHNRLGPRSS
jgi:hypothetical protein